MKEIIIQFASVIMLILPNQFLGGAPKQIETGPTVPTVNIKTLKPIKPIDVATAPKEIEPVQPVVVTPPPVESAPAPTVAPTGGCQTYWSGDVYLDNIIRFESGGNSCATNPGGCFGLLQACPGAPLRAACGGEPACQIAWFQANKTGGRSWAQVWQHELDFGWW